MTMDANWGHHFHFNNPNLQMNIHGSCPINIVLFNYTIVDSKSLDQNITKCFFKS
jgi:hypothetical protein